MTHAKRHSIKTTDIAVVFAFPIFATFLSILFSANLFVTTILFYAPLALFLSWRKPSVIKKTLLFAAIFSLPYNLFVYLGALNTMSYVSTIFPSHVFGSLPFEDTVWFFLFVYSTIMFYEYFLDKRKHSLFSRKMTYLLALIVLSYFFFFVFYHINPTVLVIPYFYFWMGIILFFIPILGILLMYPSLIARYAVTGGYFFIHSFLFEITSLQLKHWTFPGVHFIGWVDVLGYTFPFEELFFFLLLCSLGVLTYFEVFDTEKIK